MSALHQVRILLARIADERERTGAYTRETWGGLCRALERLSPDDARRVEDAVRRAVVGRPR